jgi:cytochrome oxidase assembly protein ShyY1
MPYVRGVRSLLAPRRIAMALAVVLLAAACVQLGRWQLHRLGDRQDRNAVTQANLAADPVPLQEVVTAGQSVGREQEWRRVTATGRYDERNQVVIKYRNVRDRPGFEVVTPLLLPDGTAVLVDRGFLPRARGSSDVPPIPPAPSGQVTVTGRLRHSERGDTPAVTPVDGQARLINAGAIAAASGLRLVDGYLTVDEQTPPPDEAWTQPPLPELDSGPHFFYALQWFFFALLAIGGLVYFTREDVRSGTGEPETAATAGAEDRGLRADRRHPDGGAGLD